MSITSEAGPQFIFCYLSGCSLRVLDLLQDRTGGLDWVVGAGDGAADDEHGGSAGDGLGWGGDTPLISYGTACGANSGDDEEGAGAGFFVIVLGCGGIVLGLAWLIYYIVVLFQARSASSNVGCVSNAVARAIACWLAFIVLPATWGRATAFASPNRQMCRRMYVGTSTS